MNNRKNKLLGIIILIVLVATILAILTGASGQRTDSNANVNYADSYRSFNIGEYTIGDIRNMLEHQCLLDPEYIRIHSLYDDVQTYEVLLENEEMDFTAHNIQPSNALTATVIFGNHLCPDNSIVIVLMADGFTAGTQANQIGQWPMPVPNTFLWQAHNAMVAMMNTHPFREFAHLFRVYAVRTVSAEVGISRDHPVGYYIGNGPTRNNFFGTHFIAPSSLRMPSNGRSHARVIANATNSNFSMIQVIANTRYNSHGGVAYWRPFSYTDSTRLAITSTQMIRSASPWNTPWHGTFVHEFGHSFGELADEHENANNLHNRQANATRNGNANTVKWQHMRGHGRVLEAPRSIGGGWYVPAATSNGCIMRASWSSNQFSAVSAAELTRRMALISSESFFGKSFNERINNPIPSIPHFTMPSNENRIVPYAFHGNTTLQSVTIAGDFVEIGNFAFVGATNLRTITVTALSLPTINNTTFAGLDRGLITVHIPAGRYQSFRNAGWTGFNLDDGRFTFEHIGNANNVRIRARAGVVLMGSVEIPSHVMIGGVQKTVTEIAPNAFLNNTAITSVTFPPSVITIGTSAFNGATSLSTVIFASPNASLLQSIGANAFARTAITSITIPHSVQTIGISAFANATNLTTVTFSSLATSQLTSIGSSAFNNTNVTNITLPSRMSTGTIQHNSFSANTNVTINNQFTFRGQTFVRHINTADITFTIPAHVATRPITQIASDAFAGSSLTSVTIPLDIDTIAATAFGGWQSSQTINIQGRLTAPNGWAAGWMSNATIVWDDMGLAMNNGTIVGFNPPAGFGDTLVIPIGATAIGANVFAGFNNLRYVTVPACIQTIGNLAFHANTTVEWLDNFVFRGNTFVRYLVPPIGIHDVAYFRVPSSVAGRTITHIAENAFSGFWFNEITIPSSITSIGANAFAHTRWPRLFLEPRSSITPALLANQVGIGDIVISPGLSAVQTGSFNNIFSTIILAYGWTNIPTGLLAGVNNSIQIPASVTSIASHAFAGATNLSHVFFEGSSRLNSIGASAFSGTNLANITLPDRTLTVGTNAFAPHTVVRWTNRYEIRGNEFRRLLRPITQGMNFTVPTSILGINMTSIAPSAFNDARFNTITVPSGITSLGHNSFALNTRVNWLNNFDFRGSEFILFRGPGTTFTVPASVAGRTITSIASNAFTNFTHLNTAFVPSTVTTLGNNAFFAGTTVRWESNFRFQGHLFVELLRTTGNSFTVPYYIAGRSISIIGTNAFSGRTNLTELIIHQSITSLRDSAFNGLANLTTIRNQRQTPQTVNANTFAGLNRGAVTLYVPHGTRQAFLNAGWSGFRAINDGTSTCVATGTLITLYDGSQVAVENLTGNEILLVWCFRTGRFRGASMLFVESDGVFSRETVLLNFSSVSSGDGLGDSYVRIIDSHGFFNLTLNRHVRVTVQNASDFVGHYFLSYVLSDCGGIVANSKRLDNYLVEYYVTGAFNPIVPSHFTFFANGLLTSPGAFVRVGFLNIFDVCEDTLKYCQYNYNYLVEEFGLLSLTDFRKMHPALTYFPQELFYAFNGQYLTIATQTGNMCWLELFEFISAFAEQLGV